LLRERFAGVARLGTRQLCKAEIEDLRPSVVREKNILRLQVAMDDALLVRRS